MFEALENRRMFSVTATMWGPGTLYVTGDAADNVISLQRIGPNVEVYERGATVGSFPLASVSFISLSGGDGNDRLSASFYGFLAVDRPIDFYGGNGDDIMTGGTGSDWFFGGPGNDTADYWGRFENLNLSIDGIANDGPIGSATEFDNIRLDVERVTGGIGNDTITGSNDANILDGSGGSDHIYGLEGNDWIIGGNGNDFLYGDGGSDCVFGDAGNDFVSGHRDHYTPWDDAPDFLFGGLGTDTLVGLGGQDHYNSNDDNGESDVLYVSFGAGAHSDRVFRDLTDIVM